MARSGMPDSAGSQFFIMVDDAPFLDGQYAAFGKVIAGIETADAIVAVDRDVPTNLGKIRLLRKLKLYPELYFEIIMFL